MSTARAASTDVRSYGKPFALAVDRERGLLRVTLDGLWSDANADAFEQEMDKLRTAVIAVGDARPLTRILVVILYTGVQPQDIAARLQQLLARDQAGERRVAVLASGALL